MSALRAQRRNGLALPGGAHEGFTEKVPLKLNLEGK